MRYATPVPVNSDQMCYPLSIYVPPLFRTEEMRNSGCDTLHVSSQCTLEDCTDTSPADYLCQVREGVTQLDLVEPDGSGFPSRCSSINLPDLCAILSSQDEQNLYSMWATALKDLFGGAETAEDICVDSLSMPSSAHSCPLSAVADVDAIKADLQGAWDRAMNTDGPGDPNMRPALSSSPRSSHRLPELATLAIAAAAAIQLI